MILSEVFDFTYPDENYMLIDWIGSNGKSYTIGSRITPTSDLTLSAKFYWIDHDGWI